MGDLTLNYRACGAECREDWLRMLANENGLPFGMVQQFAEECGPACKRDPVSGVIGV
jgi:hypothetical protein